MTWSIRPLFDLRLDTARLRLRLPTPDDLTALADLAADGVHDPAVQPFLTPWTDAPPADRARATMQYHWSRWAAWRPECWSLPLVAEHDGVIVGTQELMANDFAVLREVSTGSWLGRRYHGLGFGTEMRAAVLALGFSGLGAEYAVSGAHSDNLASLGVSRKLGYVEDGIERHVVRGRQITTIRLRMDRAGWHAQGERFPVDILNLEPCLPAFVTSTSAQRD
jgi:RimJ/RimL family protein N-acetyltransferase